MFVLLGSSGQITSQLARQLLGGGHAVRVVGRNRSAMSALGEAGAELAVGDPADAAREAPRVYISAWPKDGVKSEFSVRLGFPAKKGSEITAAVGKETFRMFASDERAYVKDETGELKLVDAMRKGSKLAITATTATGTEVADSYSLSGLSQALQELQSTCK